ncbi:MAG: V4R domain-containing protein [Candidatus Syntropharchaeia archaeon]
MEQKERDKKIIIRVRDSWSARSFLLTGNEKSEIPVCSIELGFLAGIFEEILGKTVEGNESKCEAMGDSYCERIFYIQD